MQIQYIGLVLLALALCHTQVRALAHVSVVMDLMHQAQHFLDLSTMSLPLEVPSFDTSGVQDALNSAKEVPLSIVDMAKSSPFLSGEAWSRAGSVLGKELSEKGEILTTNTAGGLTNTGNAIGQIKEGLVNIGVPKVVDASNTVGSFLKESTLGGVKGIVEPVEKITSSVQDGSFSVGVDPRIVEKWSGIGSRIGSWKLFSDDSHMETGFWETSLQKTAKVAESVPSVDLKKVAENLSSVVSK